MANTLTNLIPVFYQALDRVSREKTGFIPNVAKDVSADSVGKDQTVRVPIAPASSASDITPAATAPVTGSQTIGYADIAISKSRYVPLLWNGEEQKSVSGIVGNVLEDQIAQAIRTLNNEVEADIAALYAKSSRAYGTAGTSPFTSSLEDAAQIRKILDDNGAPLTDRSLVIDSTAGAKLRTLGQLTKANEAGDTNLLRQGSLLDLHGFMVRESSKVAQVTKGTGASYLLNLGSPAIGTTTIPADTGSGTILAGDVVTFAGTTDKYVVNTALSGGSFTIGAPGLVAAETDNDAITVGNNYTPNFGFRRSSLVLACRAPAVPTGGDSADDAMMLTDPVTGLSFEVRMYRQYRQVKFEICMAWGTAGIKSAHNAILLG